MTQAEAVPEPLSLPVSLLKTVWPPNDGLRPGSERFDAMLTDVRANGIREAITINLEWVLIDGHHRLAAARLLGMERVPVRVWTGTEFLP